MEKKTRITFSVTPRQARIVWGVIDGHMDAASGNFEGAMTEEEREALAPVALAFLKASLGGPKK